MLVRAGLEGVAAGVLGERLGLVPANLSFHLNQLRYAGLVWSRREGRSIIYAANFDAMNDFIALSHRELLRGADSGPAQRRAATGSHGRSRA